MPSSTLRLPTPRPEQITVPSLRVRRLRPPPVFFFGLVLGALFIGGLRAHAALTEDDAYGADEVLPPMVLPEPVQLPTPPAKEAKRAAAPAAPAATGPTRASVPPTVALESLPRVGFSNVAPTPIMTPIQPMTPIPTVQLESLPVATEPLHSPPSRRKYARYSR